MNVKQKIYQIVDSFLVEAKNQDGEERSLERLNGDRHLTVNKIIEVVEKVRQEAYSAGAKEERERIKELIKGLKTDERKVRVYGKGKDSWEAINYDEKMLVNAVLKDLEKVIIEKKEVIKNGTTKNY